MEPSNRRLTSGPCRPPESSPPRRPPPSSSSPATSRRASCCRSVAEAEATETFPREMFRTLGRAGLLGLPYAEEYGGGGQPYEVYLQVRRGDRHRLGQRRRRRLGARALLLRAGHQGHRGAEAEVAARHARRRAARRLLPLRAARRLRPVGDEDPSRRDGDEYVLNGAKAWTTHGGHADFYKVMARTSDDRNGISCFLVPADTDGPQRRPARAEDGPHRLGDRDDAVRRRPHPGRAAPRRGGRRAEDRAGRARLRTARHRRRWRSGSARRRSTTRSAYAKERQQFGQPIIDFQGLAFLLADMEAARADRRGR